MPAGILSYFYQLSDDGKFAITEFVGTHPAAFTAILSDKVNVLKSFQKGKNTVAEIEAEFKKYKKDFDLTKFGGVNAGLDIAAQKGGAK